MDLLNAIEKLKENTLLKYKKQEEIDAVKRLLISEDVSYNNHLEMINNIEQSYDNSNSEKNISSSEMTTIIIALEKVLEKMKGDEREKCTKGFSILNLIDNITSENDLYAEVLWIYNSDDNIDCSFENIVSMVFNPIINYLRKKNYAVELKKINTYEPLLLKDNSIIYLNQIEELEECLKNKNYGDVCTKSFSILQSLFKEILEEKGIAYGQKDDLPKLYNSVKNVLNMMPGLYGNDDSDKNLRIFTGNINTCIKKICEIRNIYSSSHGLTGKEKEKFDNLPPHHYKMIVDLTKTICNFLLGTFDYQTGK